MNQLDFLWGKCVIQIMKGDFIGAISCLEERINANETEDETVQVLKIALNYLKKEMERLNGETETLT